MKISALLLSAMAATFALSSLAAEAPISARAAANQTKMVSRTEATPAVTLAYVGATAPAISARAQANQSRVLKGTNNDPSSTLTCRNMLGSGPKAIQACTEHPATMPGCNPVTVAPLK